MNESEFFKLLTKCSRNRQPLEKSTSKCKDNLFNTIVPSKHFNGIIKLKLFTHFSIFLIASKIFDSYYLGIIEFNDSPIIDSLLKPSYDTNFKDISDILLSLI